MVNLSRHMKLLACLAAVLLVAAACVPIPPASPTPAATTAPATAPVPSTTITGIVWQWTSLTNQTTRQTETIPDPTKYTITFNPDGTLTGQADCNSFNGTYSQQNGFSIKLGASTMVACPEGSLDQQYLTLLSSVAAGGPDGAGNFALETAGGEQRMLFRNGGSAAAPAPSTTLTGIVWQWTSVTSQSTKEMTTVPDPTRYTVTFSTGGTLTGQADCNMFTGTYSQQNGFSIKLGASTMAACGEASLDQQYLTLLSNVAAGGPDGAGNLALETAGGEQRMLFKNGGSVPE